MLNDNDLANGAGFKCVMITERGQILLSQRHTANVDADLVMGRLTGSNLFEQSLAFEGFTGASRDAIVAKLPTDTDIPMMLLEYLLKCVSADASAGEREQAEGWIHSRGEAFLELRVPLAAYWEKHGRLLSEERYFARIAEFFKERSYVFYSEIVTHTLEAWSPTAQPYRSIMKGWKSDPALSKYAAGDLSADA